MADGLDQLFSQAVARHQQGDLSGAIGLYRLLLGLRPNLPALHINLGIALQNQRKLDEAADCFRQAIALDPLVSEAHNSLGCVLNAQGRPAEAMESLRRAQALAPHQGQPLNNLGNALRLLEKYDEAADAYRQAAALEPASPQPWCNLAAVLLETRDVDGAIAASRRALELDPAQPEAWNCLGNAYVQAERLSEAEEAFRQAPQSAEAGTNLAALLYDQERFEDAAAQAELVTAAHPGYVQAFNNLGNALMAQNKLTKAELAFRQGLALAPDDAHIRLNLSSVLLKQSLFDEGWEAYEARREVPWSPLLRRDYGLPAWDGSPLDGGGLLLHAEQGYGDCLQFCRFAPLLEMPVVLMVEPALKRLLADSFAPKIVVIARGEAVPVGLAAQAPLMSLPYLLGGGIPMAESYLKAENASVWRDRLAALPGRKIGLVWAGAPRPYSKIAHLLDKRRSIPLKSLESLGTIPGISWVSLQKSDAAGETVPGLQLIDWTAELGDFADTAALVAGLDLVISVDTSVAHLAAALGKPTWILSRFDGCWRWLQGRDDSPWYPSVRLFRQERQGDWDDVVERVKAALTA
ncbi:MAG TPA: tetratricopeptide repeat protein [Candidatus Sulfotelmatobacter sp.]|jgi:Flp pilus assembly protein TadD|nr:tetratricopeptide repeat protein [Candidatus Sulfotelmatobacter sp.]